MASVTRETQATINRLSRAAATLRQEIAQQPFLSETVTGPVTETISYLDTRCTALQESLTQLEESETA